VLGIRDGRFEDLLDEARALLGAERQDVERLLDTQPADLVSDQPRLLRRDART
jgi:hypothetical protein